VQSLGFSAQGSGLGARGLGFGVGGSQSLALYRLAMLEVHLHCFAARQVQGQQAVVGDVLRPRAAPTKSHTLMHAAYAHTHTQLARHVAAMGRGQLGTPVACATLGTPSRGYGL